MTRAEALGAAIRVEAAKFVAARVPVVAAIMLVAGVTAISAAVVLASANGPSAVVAKLGPLAAEGGWVGYLTSATQVLAAGGFLASGVVVGWVHGREFADGTVAGLFALPVSRTDVAIAKLLGSLGWALLVAVVLPVVLVVTGLAAGFGAPGDAEVAMLVRLTLLVPLTALMATPAAWVATVARGPLGGIAVTVLLVACSQVLVFSGVGEWFPPAAPALWAMDPGATDPAAMLVGAWWPALAIALTVLAWRRLQLDRS